MLCTIALIFAVEALLNGGRSMAMGSAVVYGVLATAGSLAFALYIRKAKNVTGSALVAVDAESWTIDTLLSGAVLLAFILGWMIQGTSLNVYLDYLDPAVVALLCLVSLPVPIKILVDNAREVLLFAPDPRWQQSIEECLKKATPHFVVADYRIRLLKMGNTLNVLVHLKAGPGFELGSIDQLDEVRFKFNAELKNLDVKIAADIVFIGDMKLAE